jgi:hypothetical protein
MLGTAAACSCSGPPRPHTGDSRPLDPDAALGVGQGRVRPLLDREVAVAVGLDLLEGLDVVLVGDVLHGLLQVGPELRVHDRRATVDEDLLATHLDDDLRQVVRLLARTQVADDCHAIGRERLPGRHQPRVGALLGPEVVGVGVEVDVVPVVDDLILDIRPGERTAEIELDPATGNVRSVGLDRRCLLLRGHGTLSAGWDD